MQPTDRVAALIRQLHEITNELETMFGRPSAVIGTVVITMIGVGFVALVVLTIRQ